MKQSKKIIAGALCAAVALGSTAGLALGLSNRSSADDTFVPVFRMAVCSDVHVAGANNPALQKKFDSFFKQAYDYAETHEKYETLDAVVVTGDLTHVNTMGQMAGFRETVYANLKRETTFLSIIGNHDLDTAYQGNDPFTGEDVYKNIVDEELDKHLVVKGFHLIGISNSDANGQFNQAVPDENGESWLSKQLAIAAADDAEKPIFTFQHFHLTDTVFNSAAPKTGSFPSAKNSADLDNAYKAYPQVVNFSGHSHGAGLNTRGIYQKDYTVVDVPAFQHLSGGSSDQILESAYTNGHSIANLASDGKLYKASEAASMFRIVEVDANNVVRIYTYDLNTNSLAKTAASTDGDAVLAFEIEKPTDKSTFAYTDEKYADATAPFWTNGALTVDQTEATPKFTFTQADEDDCMFGYTLTLSADGQETLTYKLLDAYYLADNTADETFALSETEAAKLAAGVTYTATVTATNVWGLTSTQTLTATFTA